MHNYKNLKVWIKAVELSTTVYSVTENFPAHERFGLTSQLRRASVSIASNIAVGAGRASDNEFSHFLSIANGSCYEMATQLIISKNLNYLSEQSYSDFDDKISEVQKMIYRLKESLNKVISKSDY